VAKPTKSAPKEPALTADYQAPPVPDVQAQMAALEGGRRAALPERQTAAQVQASHLASLADVNERLEEQRTHNPPPSGPTAEQAEQSHAASIEEIRRLVTAGTRPGDSTDRAAALARDRAAHEASLELIRAEIAAGTKTQSYSG
jgi:hypothetical protein